METVAAEGGKSDELVEFDISGRTAEGIARAIACINRMAKGERIKDVMADFSKERCDSLILLNQTTRNN